MPRDTSSYLNQNADSVKIPRIGQPFQCRAVVKVGNATKLSELLAVIANNDLVVDDSILPPGTYDITANLNVKRTSR